MIDTLVIGAGPAGVLAALRAADLGARTMLVTRAEFGGMAANDGPVPVRTLAHAARLIREARQLGQYGIGVSEPVLDYPRLLARVREVVKDARAHSSLRQQIDSLGVTVHEHAGVARFADEHTIETQDGLRLEAEKVIICTGGVSRRLSVPGFELANTHSDAWRLTSVPPSMLVVGAGATGVQLRRWRYYRSADAGPAGDTGRLRGGYERRARPDDGDWGPGESYRQLHRPGVCPSGPHRSKGP